MKTNHDGTITLNASNSWTSCLACGQRVTGDSIHTCSPQIKELTDRIAELEKGEEVAGRFYWESVVDGHVMAVPSEGTPHYNKDDFPLYTTPQIKELSDEEIIEIGNAVVNLIDSNEGWIEFARAILKKASEK